MFKVLIPAVVLHSFYYIKYILLFCGLLASTLLHGQISSPGLGDAHTASWFALGLRQGLDHQNHKQLMTYVGMGRISTPADENPTHKSAIWVINQEFYNQFHTHWQYSVALSYRQQNVYEDSAPYAAADPSIKQEFRSYGRFSYVYKKTRYKFVFTFRQEVRTFYTPDFIPWSEDLELRTRLRGQFTLHLNEAKTHHLLLSAEALGSTSRTYSTKEWEKFSYQESRFCLYYSWSPKVNSLQYSIGYMNDLLGNQAQLQDVHYIAIDIIWENPFGKVKEKIKPVEYFE